MGDFLFKKVELWLVALVVLLLVPLSVFWGVKMVESRVYPWPVVEELRAFVAGDPDEDISLGQKLLSLVGLHDRFEVPQQDNPPAVDVLENITYDLSYSGPGYTFQNSRDSGHYLIYGVMALAEDENYQPTAILIGADGVVRRSWVFPFLETSQDIRRMGVSDNGVLVSTSANRLRAQSWCGEKLWESPEDGFHHEIDYAQGRFTVWLRDQVVSVDEWTGEHEMLVDMRRIVLANPDIPLLRATMGFFKYHAPEPGMIFDMRQERPPNTRTRLLLYNGDNFHQNKATINHGTSSWFADDAILISMREIDMVAVVEPASGKVLWHATYNRQHDPDWMEDGFMLYNNRSHFEFTRIERQWFDGRHEVLVGEDTLPWSRRITGNSELYPDGSILFQGNDGFIHHIDANKELFMTFESNALMRNAFWFSDQQVAEFEATCP